MSRKKVSPAPLRDAGVVTYIQPHLIPHLILRGVIGLVALARRTFPRRCQPQLLVPTRRFHEVSGARRRSVPKLRKLSVGLSANHDPMCRVGPAARESSWKLLRVECRIGEARSGEIVVLLD